MSNKDDSIFDGDILSDGVDDRGGEVTFKMFAARGDQAIHYTNEEGKIDAITLDFIMDYDSCTITERKQIKHREGINNRIYKYKDKNGKLKDIGLKASKENYTLKLEFNSEYEVISDELPKDSFRLSKGDISHWDILIEEGTIYLLLLQEIKGNISEDGLLVSNDERVFDTEGFLVNVKKANDGRPMQKERIKGKDGRDIQVVVNQGDIISDHRDYLVGYVQNQRNQKVMCLLDQHNTPLFDAHQQLVEVTLDYINNLILKANGQPLLDDNGDKINLVRSQKRYGFSITIENFYFKTIPNDITTYNKEAKLEILYRKKREPFFQEDATGTCYINYKFIPEMKKLPIYPIVRAFDTDGITLNRAGILINNNKKNYLLLQLINISSDELTFESGSQWFLSIPASSNRQAPHTLTTQTSGFTYSVRIKSSDGATRTFSDLNVTSYSNNFTVKLKSPITIGPYDYIEIKIKDFTTDLSPRTGFIKFSYTKAIDYRDGDIIIPVSIQPMTMEGKKVLIASKDSSVEITGNEIQLYQSDKLLLELGEYGKGGYINFFNQGSLRNQILSGSNSGTIKIFNKNRQTNVAITGNQDNGTITLYNKDNKIILLEKEQNSGAIRIFNESAKRLFSLSRAGNTQTMLGLYNNKAERKIELIVPNSGKSWINKY